MSVAQRSGASDAYGAQEPGGRQALARLYADHYQTLVRVAALLTGDERCADDVVVDSFAALWSAGLADAGDRALSYLRQQVVLRSRRVTLQAHARDRAAHRPAHNAQPGWDGHGRGSPAREFGGLPAVLGLMTLRPAEREAVVLTTYLDLPEQQAAAAAGVRPAALRRYLASATEVLRGWPA
jgi:DNA-directed RNA polymerase specialized sigma24 family protein